jgi:hypothetical protein
MLRGAKKEAGFPFPIEYVAHRRHNKSTVAVYRSTVLWTPPIRQLPQSQALLGALIRQKRLDRADLTPASWVYLVRLNQHILKIRVL